MEEMERYGKVEVRMNKEGLDRLQTARPEDEKLRRLVEAGYDCRRGGENSWEVLYHLSHLRGNLTGWLPIGAQDTVLEFGADTGQLTGGYLAKAGRVICMEESISRCRILAMRYEKAENLEVWAGDPWENLERTGRLFDWILAPGVLAEARRYFAGEAPEAEAVRRLIKYLKPGGRLVLVSDNRFGLKYWAGAMEPHTGRYFDSLEGNGVSFSRKELEQILRESGCGTAAFYYPYPERWFPTAVYSDEWLPKAGELDQNLRNFEGERLLLFDEKKVYDRLIADGRYPEFANAYVCVVGPEAEERVIYCKYSNDRAERFMLRTDIVKNAAGYEVRKVPLTKAAEKHVRNMKSWEEILDRSYKKNHISANRCELRSGTACFEFLKGRTLEAELDELRSRKDYSGLLSRLFWFRELLTETLKPEAKPFKVTETFLEMFGSPSFEKAYEGADVNNLDWIFGNLMETEAGIQIIDYEWTFPVQVPVEYLLWRALSLYLHSREDLEHLGLMAQMGISPREEEIFAGMEHHFQMWLLDGTVTIGARYLATAGRTIGLPEMTGRAEKDQIQVYVDTGSGFRESESFRLRTEPDKQGIVHLELLLPEGVRALRLDPAETPCLLKVRRLLGELGGSYPLAWVHNVRELEEQGILYTTTDPQITVPEVVPGTGRVYAEFTVQELYPDTAYACMNLLNRVRAAERLYDTGVFRLMKKVRRLLRR